MLTKEGILFIGDIPNISMKKRFLESENGIKFKNSYSKKNEKSQKKNLPEYKKLIDDDVIFKILSRARELGFHSWVVPQKKELTFANRREDIIIQKP